MANKFAVGDEVTAWICSTCVYRVRFCSTDSLYAIEWLYDNQRPVCIQVFGWVPENHLEFADELASFVKQVRTAANL